MDDIKIRVIDSKKLIDAINAGSYEINLSAVMALGAVVTQSASQWIPCSERLPKPNEYENDVRKYYLVQNEYGDMMVCSWDGHYWEQMYCNTPVKNKVVAWMPLPTPWSRKETGE